MQRSSEGGNYQRKTSPRTEEYTSHIERGTLRIQHNTHTEAHHGILEQGTEGRSSEFPEEKSHKELGIRMGTELSTAIRDCQR